MITIGSPPLSFYLVQAAALAAMLRRSGNTVQTVSAWHEDLYPMLKRGEVDLIATSWLPNAHAPYWAPCGDEVVKVGRFFEGAAFCISVPTYLYQQGVTAITDLATSNVERTILSLAPGAPALNARLQVAVGAYCLESAGFRIETAPESEWIARSRAAVKANRSVAIAVWQPCFLNAELNLSRLADPQMAMGPTDTGWITANRRFIERADAGLMATLRSASLGIEAINDLDARVVIEGLSPREAYERWSQDFGEAGATATPADLEG